MKLRNKKTGEIIEIEIRIVNNDYFKEHIIETDKGEVLTIKKLNEEWEDYEEPKEVWYIDFQGIVRSASKEENDWFKENEISNYFETEEEAKKAVEKLKAWKRLKDKGFKWRYYSMGDGDKFRVYFSIKDGADIGTDLDLLFGGEE